MDKKAQLTTGQSWLLLLGGTALGLYVIYWSLAKMGEEQKKKQ